MVPTVRSCFPGDDRLWAQPRARSPEGPAAGGARMGDKERQPAAVAVRYGAGAEAPARYESIDYSGGAVLVFGSEGRGLRPRVAGACDLLVSVPVAGRVETLSVAAAAAVLLYARRPG